MKRFIAMSLLATQNLKSARDDIMIERLTADKQDYSTVQKKPNRERLTELIRSVAVPHTFPFPFFIHSVSISYLFHSVLLPFCQRSVVKHS